MAAIAYQHRDGRLAALEELAQLRAQEPVARVVLCGATVALEWDSVAAAHNCKPGPLYAAQPAQPAEQERDAIAELNHAQWLALENVRLLAARHRKEEWAQHMLRFVDEAGTNKARITRRQVEESRPKQQLNIAREMLRALEYIECVHRKNCVAEGEPSSVLDELQRIIRRASDDFARSATQAQPASPPQEK